MNISDKLITIAENQLNIYDKGYEDAKIFTDTETGKKYGLQVTDGKLTMDEVVE